MDAPMLTDQELTSVLGSLPCKILWTILENTHNMNLDNWTRQLNMHKVLYPSDDIDCIFGIRKSAVKNSSNVIG